MEDEVQKPEPGLKKSWPLFMSWVGSASALIGLFVTLAGGITWIVSHHRQQAERQAKMALAEAQEKQGEYQASIRKLRRHPQNRLLFSALPSTSN